MKAKYTTPILSTLGLLLTAGAASAENIPTDHTPKIILDVRARYEYGDQENLDPAHAATLRARLGLESQTYYGFSGLFEFEATRALDDSSYNSGVNGEVGKTVIADPESTEINRIQLKYVYEGNAAILGRQRIILDNARFVGNVGWRQNEQTYDAVSYKNTMVKDLTLFYAYIDQVNRIFGSEAPSFGKTKGELDSNSHLINAQYKGLKGHKFAAYGYLLDFDNSKAQSSDTFGANYTINGTVADDYALTGYAEFAYQQAASDNPVDYSAPYYHLNGKVAREGYSGNVGFEVLGSDGGVAAFQTPLATGHKFNGWNDQFLATPADGLRDLYLGVGIPVPKVPMQLIYHYFTADEGSTTYGHEIDAVASYAISKSVKTIAKYSYFASANETPGTAYNNDRSRFSIEIDYKF